MNEDIQPDFAFRDKDIQFLQSMDIELCDNCFRPQNGNVTRKIALESVISFWIYHILVMIVIRIPIAIVIFSIAFAILVPFVILPASFCCCFGLCCLCCCKDIAETFMSKLWWMWYIVGKLLDWFDEPDQVQYEVRIVNTNKIWRSYTKNKKQNDSKPDCDEFINEFVNGFLFQIFIMNNLTNTIERNRTKSTEDIDRIRDLFIKQIKNKRFEPIVLISNIDWESALKLSDSIQRDKSIFNNDDDNDDNNKYNKYYGICECVIEPCRILLKFDDIGDEDQFDASEQTRKDYHFANSPVLNRIQSMND